MEKRGGETLGSLCTYRLALCRLFFVNSASTNTEKKFLLGWYALKSIIVHNKSLLGIESFCWMLFSHRNSIHEHINKHDNVVYFHAHVIVLIVHRGTWIFRKDKVINITLSSSTKNNCWKIRTFKVILWPINSIAKHAI